MESLKISIGEFSQEYKLFKTTAPVNYDGGGAIEMYNGGKERHVLVPIEAIAWHDGRYHSGLHSFESEELDVHMIRYLTGKLMDRIQGIEK